jgi:hypothetical protein
VADSERDDALTEAGELLRRGHLEAAAAEYMKAAEARASAGQYGRAADVLREFVALVPQHIPALLKLVQVSVAGSLQAATTEARGLLADAYLAAGRPEEGLTLAEALVAREPWDPVHLERFRRALLMLKVPDPDVVIAERLAGERPFVASDRPPADAGDVHAETDAGTETGG